MHWHFLAWWLIEHWAHHRHLRYLLVPSWPARPPVPGTFCVPGGGVCTG